MREKKICEGSEGMISVVNVSKDYGPFRALHGISFEVKRGEVLGLLGPNGAGKTTALRILTGFFPPTEGKVTLDGVNLFKDPTKLKRRIGYLPESVSLYGDLRVEEFLNWVAGVKRVSRRKRKAEVLEKMARCGVESVRGRLVGHLSKGYLQRVGLAQALIGNPDVLVLDEPSNGLDPQQIIQIRELIRELGRERTLILSTHILPEVSRLCERVLILNQGRIVAQGKPSELERGLRDRQEILVRIGNGRDAVSLESVLLYIPGVESVERTVGEDSAATYLVRTLPSEDLRPEIAKRIVEAGFSLLELATRTLSLEDIFLKLVLSEEPIEAL